MDNFKEMPQALDAEIAVLGAMLLDNKSIELIAPLLSSQHFYWARHQKIYETILDIYSGGKPVDLVELDDRLKNDNELEKCGGRIYLASLLENVVSSLNIKNHAELVLKKAILRQSITAAEKIIIQAYKEPDDLDKFLDFSEHEIFELRNRKTHQEFLPLHDILHTTYSELEKLHNNKKDIIGVPTGFPSLDSLTAGFQNGDMILLAGRPSLGKSAMALCIARNAAIDYHVPVAFLSLEMTNHQLMQRLISSEARVDSKHLRTGRLAQEEWNQIADHLSKLSNAPIYIDDSPQLSILDIRARGRRLKAEKNIGLMIIDYLQLIEGPKHSRSRLDEVTTISKMLKALAKELNIPILVLSQLSRAVEFRGGDRKPQLSDLRDSGALEQDADVVMFVYRPEWYKPDDMALWGKAQIILAKQRNGPTGVVHMEFNKRFTRFDEADWREF